jgi:hypothetical protein
MSLILEDWVYHKDFVSAKVDEPCLLAQYVESHSLLLDEVYDDVLGELVDLRGRSSASPHADLLIASETCGERSDVFRDDFRNVLELFLHSATRRGTTG